MAQTLKVLVTGDNGESLPPPYGGIIKRCLLHAKIWKTYGASVYIHVHHQHEKEEDLGAGAQYFYDFAQKPSSIGKTLFFLKNFLASPRLFVRLVLLQRDLFGKIMSKTFFYCAGRAIFLDKMVKEIKPDVVITETGGPQSLMSLEIAKRNDLPIILENYAEIQFKEKDGKNIAETLGKFWRYLVNSVDLVVPSSHHCAQGPLKYLENPDKIKIVYSGINFNIFNGMITNDKMAARKKFGLPLDKFLVMAVGALRMRKGHDQLFEAILKLPEEQLAKISVVLCGMGPVEEMKSKARELGFPMESLSVFQGLTEEDLAELYSAMDCFCFPSITPRECMGMAMKEAMALGLPVAAYDTGGIREAIEDGVNGFLVPTGDKQALAAAIEKIIRLDETQRNMIRHNNVIKARRLFDIKNTAGQLYQEILKTVESYEKNS